MNTAAKTDPTTALVDTEDLHIDVTCDVAADGTTIELTRTVWQRAYRAKDRNILHQECIGKLSTLEAVELLKDLGSALAFASSSLR